MSLRSPDLSTSQYCLVSQRRLHRVLASAYRLVVQLVSTDLKVFSGVIQYEWTQYLHLDSYQPFGVFVFTNKGRAG